METTAIIVAAGSGTRFNSEKPKQFVDLAGKPVMIHTLEKFQAAPSVDRILVVLEERWWNEFDDLRAAYDIGKITELVPGGITRAESTWKGICRTSAETGLVLVHDAVRPLVTVDEIERTAARAKQTGAACLVAQVTDTIKTVREHEIAATIDRSQLRRALTPQAFRLEVLRAAFDGVELDESITDECFLVEKLGHPISIVEGNSRNIKITRRDDLAIAEALLRENV